MDTIPVEAEDTVATEDTEVSSCCGSIKRVTVADSVPEGNGGLTTYYGYGRDDYYGDRNVGFGYQQGTNTNGFSREGDRNLNYNSYPNSATSASSGGYYY